jgi:protein-S-isoprenylcysteine O-methyltransferase Ste14
LFAFGNTQAVSHRAELPVFFFAKIGLFLCYDTFTMAILRLLPLIFWIILWAYWFISAFHAKKSVRKNSWWFQAFWIRLAILAIVVFAISTGHGGILGDLLYLSTGAVASNVWLSIAGVIFCATGVAFAIWARVHLGKNWGMPMSLREKPELVTSGPYRFVRHPIYTGFLLAAFGTAFADGAVWLIVLVIMGIYFIYSAKTEEKMMAEQFPNEYPEYVKTTKMLIPFIL